MAVPLVRIPGLRAADSEVTSVDGSGVGGRRSASGNRWLWVHADSPAGSFSLVFYDSGNAGEERVIPSETDVEPGVQFCAPLPDQNAAGRHTFTTIRLDPQVLRVTVSTIP